MPDFIDVRVRVRKERMGDLAVAIARGAPYAQVLGYAVVLQDQKLLTGPGKATTKRAAVLALMAPGEPTPVAQIVAGVMAVLPKATPRQVRATLYNMANSGLLKRAGAGVYRRIK